MHSIGTVCWWIVGAPGPEYDLCVVRSYTERNTYLVDFCVYGRGPWHTGETAEVFPVEIGADNPEFDVYVERSNIIMIELFKQRVLEAKPETFDEFHAIVCKVMPNVNTHAAEYNKCYELMKLAWEISK